MSRQKVKGEGQIPCKYLLLGEAPAYNEVREGRPFVGDTGKELDNYLMRNNLHRGMFRIENVIPVVVSKQEKSNRVKMRELLSKHEIHLHDVLQTVRPEWIIALGVLANMPFKDDIDMERDHGIPYEWEGYKILPCYHPAAGLHETKRMTECMEDIKQVAKVVRGEIQVESVVEREPNYRETKGHIFVTYQNIAVDTETVNGKLWSVQFASQPNKAWFVGRDSPSIESLDRVFEGRNIILHNAMFDLQVLAQVGIHPTHWVDLMQMAYLLQLPQSLKKLAWRYLHIPMKTYKEVTSPANHRLGKEYLEKVVAMTWEDPPKEKIWDVRKQEWRDKQPQNIVTKVRRLLKTATPETDLQEKWSNMTCTEQVESKLGKMPEGQLCDIDRKDAIHYACMDADVTLQLYPILNEKGKREGLW